MSKRQYPEWMGKMRGLTAQEIQAFLDTPVVARLAMVKPNGAPYLATVWQEWDGRALYFVPRAKASFVPYIQADPRLCVSCALDRAPFTRVLFEGRAVSIEGPRPLEGALLDIGRRMARRYLGERGSEYLEATRDRPRYLITFVPETTVSWEGVEWHDRYLSETTL
jgi:nitroimidazol reductase NimA-like FMN-containing flavoprotein (pyridoxamine 5'-phosphate oxidase superfamily)